MVLLTFSPNPTRVSVTNPFGYDVIKPYYVVTNLSATTSLGTSTVRHLGNLNLHLIKETISLRESGGLESFLQVRIF